MDLLSDLVFETPSEFTLGLLPMLFILKKFLSLCGKWLEPLLCFEAVEKPEKFRFSEGMADEFEDPNNCVMLFETYRVKLQAVEVKLYVQYNELKKFDF